MESKQLLRSLGIRTTEMKLATSEQEAVDSQPGDRLPLRAQGLLPGYHSQERRRRGQGGPGERGGGGRRPTKPSCRRAVGKFPGAVIEGVTVQNMAPPGLEVIVGMATDPQFGPVLMFGLGGVWVEVLKDVSFKIVPLDRSMTPEAPSGRYARPALLDGFRGSDPVDTCRARGHPSARLGVRRQDTGGKRDGPQPHLRLPRRGHSRRCPRDPGRVDAMSSETVEQLSQHIQRRVGGPGGRQRQGRELRAPLP